MSSILTRASTTATTSKPSTAVPLYRRLLFPHLLPTAVPPPLLPAACPELNTELYDFVALALRAYITPWWSKITRYDKEFIPHVSSVLTSVIRALETRVLATDLTPLIFRDVPTLVTQHYVDFRASAAKLGTSYASGGAAPLPQLFHQLQPHMAIDADGRVDPVYVRQALDHVLKACLPVDEYEPDSERAIIREVIVKVVLTDVLPRLVQPWFIHKILFDILGPSHTKLHPPEPPDPTPPTRYGPRGPPSFHSIVVFFLSAVQYVSGLCLTIISVYKQTLQTIRQVKSTTVITSFPSKDTRNYAPRLINMLAEILNMRERSASNALLSIVEMTTGFFGHFLDRLFPYLLYKHVLIQSHIILAIKAGKGALFPNGYPGPPPMDPSLEEQLFLKNQLTLRIEGLLPHTLSSVILGSASLSKTKATIAGGNSRRDIILAALEPLSSTQCNAHFFVFLLDLILITIFPELGVSVGSQEEGIYSKSNFTLNSNSIDNGEELLESPVTPPGSQPP